MARLSDAQGRKVRVPCRRIRLAEDRGEPICERSVDAMGSGDRWPCVERDSSRHGEMEDLQWSGRAAKIAACAGARRVGRRFSESQIIRGIVIGDSSY